MIRKAETRDISRIAEILVFSKRKNYRSIFNDDYGSFVYVNVIEIIDALRNDDILLSQYFVYEDDFVKGLARIDGNELRELYADPFFEGQGIGTKLITYAKDNFNVKFLWVLEKNDRAIKFYEKNGFALTGERKEEVSQYDVKMTRE